MGFWDGLEDIVKGALSKSQQTMSDVGTVLATPAGVLIDSLKWTVSDETFKEAMSSVGDRLSRGGAAATNTLIGEESLTGWAFTSTAQALNWTYENAVENPIETLIMHEFMPPNADAVSWSEAWELSRNRSLGDTVVQWKNEARKQLHEVGLGGVGDFLADPSVSMQAGLSASMVGGPGSAFLIDQIKGRRDSRDKGDGYQEISFSDPDAVEQYGEYDPQSAVASDLFTFAASWYLDPAAKVLKPLEGMRSIRAIDPAYREGSVAMERASRASKIYDRILPERRKWGDENLDRLFGTVKYQPTGKIDDDGVEETVAVMDRLGWIDKHSAAEIYVGLGLDRMPAATGSQLATLLHRTRDIEDAALRVNTRRLIYAVAHGDARAVDELRQLGAEGRDIARIFRNTATSRSTGSIHAAVADASRSDEIAAGVAVRTNDDPAIIAEAVSEVEDQIGYQGWLYASLRDRSLRVTTKGERAVARLRGQGLGRDGSLRTGWTPLDDTVNQIVRGIKEPKSRVDEALDSSDAFKAIDEVDPNGLAGGRLVDEAPSATRVVGFNQMPVTLARGGLRLAKLAATPVRPSTYTRIADSLRGLTVPTGVLAVEDEFASQAFKVMQERLRVAKVDPEQAGALLDQIVRADNPTLRSKAVKEAEAAILKTTARRYGVSERTVERLSQRLSASQDEFNAAVNGQRYTAHTKSVERNGATAEVPGDVIVDDDSKLVFFKDDDGVMTFKLGEGNEATPILSTQTPNYVPLLNVRLAEKWLKRDRLLAPLSRVEDELAADGGLVSQTERLGIHRRTESLKRLSDAVGASADWLNSWFKRTVLGLRFGSYPIRNTSEEVMRVTAASQVSAWLDEAAQQGVFRARQFMRDARGRSQWREAYALHVRRALAEQEIKFWKSALADAEQRAVKARQAFGDSVLEADQHYIRAAELEVATAEKNIARAEAAVAEYDKSISALPGAARTHKIEGVEAEGEFPGAFHGQEGVRASDFLMGTSQLDFETTGIADRLYSFMRGHFDGGVISVRHPAQAADEKLVREHAASWRRILNLQIRQSPEAMEAVKAFADGASYDEALGRVAAFLRSPKAAPYRKMNPLRAADTDMWAEEITEMVSHYVPSQNLAKALDAGEVSMDDLLRGFENVADRPDVHALAVEAVAGSVAQRMEKLAGEWLQYLDKMGPQRTTRHPMYAIFYMDEQARLAREFARLREVEFGPGAKLSVSDINNISRRAHQHAHAQVKRMFYDASVRSTAADRLRLVYPFFAAHQDSIRFWGTAIGQDPAVLRRIQQVFQAPAQVGLVVDYEGNPVEPGTFPSSDHYVLLQVPAKWGGPKLDDPTQEQSRFKLSLSSFNLITQNGSILNPGAGPMAAIPAGWVQREIGASNEDVSKVMTWFNPFGAPRDDESTLPLDQAMPTPVKRGWEAYLAFMEKDGLYSTQFYSQRLVENQVKFHQEHGRAPNAIEAKRIVKETAEQVKWMTLLRFGASFTSPSQPQPQSKMQGLINEYRRLQKVASENGYGPLWASDRFLETYGDAYLALTKSSSEYRANLNPTYGAVAELKANEKLVDQTDPRTWQVIVGAAGEGAFSTDSYRWMQNKVIDAGTGDTLIDKRSPVDRLYATAVAQGWRDYNKAMNLLQAIATEKGFSSIDESPQLREKKAQVVKALGEQNPLWREARESPVRDFDSKVIPSLELIVKRLGKDPARVDVQAVGTYLHARQLVQTILDRRAAAGGARTLEAEANRDLALLFATLVNRLAMENTYFSDYALPGLIEKDPMYMPELIGVASG